MSVLSSPGQVTGPSQGESSGGAATLMPVDLHADRLCGLVVRVSGYRYRGHGFDPRRYQIF